MFPAAPMSKTLFALLLAAVVMTTAGVATAARLDKNLQSAMAAAAPGELIPVIVTLADQVDVDGFAARMQGPTRGQTRAELVRSLRGKAESSQRPLKTFLQQRGVGRFKELWIINGLAFRADAGLIAEVADRPEVAAVIRDIVMHAPVVTPAATPAVARWNLHTIRATDLWALGFTGLGVVVANLDSGVDPNHPDLANWRGGANSWFDPYGEHATPADVGSNGHGTAVMGVLAGGETDPAVGGIGVAPDAQWIAAKIFNDAGTADLAFIAETLQWLLDPDGNSLTDDAPDVVNMSWGLEFNPNQCIRIFEPAIQTLKAADIAVVSSAGNLGPHPATSVSPANYVDTFSVGAVDQEAAVAFFSSRGPSPCGDVVYPRAAAPGVAITTADLTSNGVIPDSYRTVSGTSFAAPHVAGVMALLLDAFPGASVAQLETALERSAVDLGPQGPDNDYGYGLIDALAAYRYLNDEPYLAVIDPSPPEQDRILDFGSVGPGNSVPRAITVRNGGGGLLSIDSIDWSVLAASPFALQDDFCSRIVLPSGESCDITIQFAPQARGDFQAAFAIPSNNSENPVTVSLAGAGNNPPPAASLVAPLNNTLIFGTSVTFRWNHPVDPDGDPVTDSLFLSEFPDFSLSTPIVVITASLHMGLWFGGLAALTLCSLFCRPWRRIRLFGTLAVLLSGWLFMSCGSGGGPAIPASFTSYTSAGLKSNTTYYWKVVSDDGQGGTSESATWHFTTN